MCIMCVHGVCYIYVFLVRVFQNKNILCVGRGSLQLSVKVILHQRDQEERELERS